MSESKQQTYAFGDYVVNVANRALLVNGREIQVQHRVFDLLVYLIENSGRAVSKDELLGTVWNGRITTDAAIARIVMKARKAVGDDSRTQEVIRTIHGHGYRFIATVRPVTLTDEITTLKKGSSQTLPAKNKTVSIALLSLVLMLGYLALDRWALDAVEENQVATPIQAESGPATLNESLGDKSIAVLPFVNRSDRPDDAFLTGGIHDDLLSSISKISSLKVISRTSVMGYQGTTKKIPKIAEELGVTHILEGGIQRSGNQVRINVQLIDAKTDRHLWAETFDQELTPENIFAVQSEISHLVADALHATLTPQEQARIEKIPTKNMEAYTAYLSGKQLMASRSMAKLRQAVMEFQLAVALDPNFSLAWVGIADSYLILFHYLGDETGNYLRASEYAINKALAIDDQNGEAQTSLASLLRHQGKPKQAEAAFRRAIELSPNYATAYHWYSHLLSGNLFRITEAMELAERAAELDPRSIPIRGNLASTYEGKGLFSSAERQYQKLLAIDRNRGASHRNLAYFYTFILSDYEKALEHAFKTTEFNPEDSFARQLPFFIYLELGDVSAAEEHLQYLREINPDGKNVGIEEVLINYYREDVTAVRASIEESKYKTMRMGGVELALGNVDRARQIYLDVFPEWFDPNQWPELLGSYPKHACIMSWILLHTGDEALGEKMLQESITFFDEQLSNVHEHVDHFWPDICYLTTGDTERGLSAIEARLERNDLFGEECFRLPMYDLIRGEPRFQAAVLEHNTRVSVQLDSINSKSPLID